MEKDFDDVDDSLETYHPSDYGTLFYCCYCYAYSEEDDEMKEKYMSELSKSFSFKTLTGTGVFHDAIGKTVDYGDDFITVTTCY